MQDTQKAKEKELMNELLIYGEPAYNLKDCLSFYTKQKLWDIASNHGLKINMSKKKEDIVSTLADQILDSLPEDLKFEDLEELITLLQVGVSEDNTEDIQTVSKLIQYRYKGWVFLFANKVNNQIIIFIPDEIKTCIAKFLENKDNLKDAKKNQELFKYLKVLNNMYGVFETKQFIKVWNEHHVDVLEASEFEYFLTKMNESFDFYWIYDNYIVDDSFADKHEVEEFLREVKNKPYYMPKISDIDIYENELVDVNSKNYIKLKNYLSEIIKYGETLEDILIEIENACVLNALPNEIIGFLQEYGIIFKDLNDTKNFMNLYFEWHNESRIWSNRGFTPNELGNANSDAFENTHLPGITSKKVGRNEPCPCGSGKKYKFCCGR